MKKTGWTGHKRLKAILCCLLLCGFGSTGWCGKIVHPWRATTVIVKAGESFEVWFAADIDQTVNSVELKGPYNTVAVSHSFTNGTWIYDHESGNTYNRRLTVTVPATAPADRYDLILKTSTGNEMSTAAVKVVKEYKSNYYIVHMSDAHRWQNETTYPVETTLRKVSAVLDVADIVSAELVFETGDHHYPNQNSAASTAERTAIMFNGIPAKGIKGLHNTSAATFIVPGNHDSPSSDYTKDASRAVTLNWYNQQYGLAYYNFRYGNGRFMGVNSGMGAVPAAQRSAATAWLSSAGSGGNFRMTAGHAGQGAVSTFEAATQLNMILVGHNHYLASSNALDVNGKMIQYVANSLRDKGTGNFEYNLFRVNNSNGTYEVLGGSQSRVRVIQNHTEANINNPSSWIPMMELSYTEPNDGSHAMNTASFVNRHNFPIYGAKVRFVMPLGSSYGVSQGVIAQAFDGDYFHIVDVQVDLSAASTTSVGIFSTEVFANNALFVSQNVPESMEPGEAATVSITMKNIGTNAWSAAAGHRLGSQNPQGNTLWTGTNRIALSQTVLPENNHTFTFDITAPNVPGDYNFQWKMVDELDPDSGWFGQSTPTVAITVAEPVRHGTILMAVDLHQNTTDPVPSGFVGWMIGNVNSNVAAPSIVISNQYTYTLTIGSGTNVACLSNPALQAGMNARNRSTGYITNSGSFTQASLMQERIASTGSATDPATGNGKGHGLYLKISGLASNTPHVIQVWGVDSTGTFSNSNVTLKDGYNYGFDATREPNNYSNLPLLGSYTVSGLPSVITDNNQYSITGTVTSDANGTIVYKQISSIDKSVMNGFVLSTLSETEPSGYEAWASTNSVGAENEDDDDDGRSNFYEYVFGGNPHNDSDTGTDPVLVKEEAGFDYIYLRRNDDPSLMYTVQVRTNLISGVWMTGGGSAQTNGTGGAYDEVTHRIPMTDVNSYIRLKITNQ